MAGSQGFGDSASSGGQGLYAPVALDVFIPNSTARILGAYVATNGTISTTELSYCKVRITPE